MFYLYLLNKVFSEEKIIDYLEHLIAEHTFDEKPFHRAICGAGKLFLISTFLDAIEMTVPVNSG